jgi:transcriptional regulator with XRE-family HTH domain
MMPLDDLHSDDAVLAELGRRLERHRLERNWTQEQLAYRAQIGRATLQRLERGRSVQSSSLIRVLRALELLDELDTLVPASLELPIAQLERERRRTDRRRARGRAHKTAPAPEEQSWQWGDERGTET